MCAYRLLRPLSSYPLPIIKPASTEGYFELERLLSLGLWLQRVARAPAYANPQTSVRLVLAAF